MKKSRRLPKKYARRVSPDTKRYVKRRMDRKSQRRKEKWRRLRRRLEVIWGGFRDSAVRWTLVSLITLGVIAFGFLLFSPAIEVREITVSRLSPRLDIEEVQEALAPMFGRHLFFLSSFEIAGLLQDSIPDIDELSIGKTYPGVLHVKIALHPLVAKLNIEAPDSAGSSGTGSSIDFLTSQGIYVATTAARDTETLPRISIVDWGVRPDPGTLLLQPTFFERMNAAELTLLRQFGQEVERRTVYLRAQEFHLLIEGKELWFDLRNPLEEQMERYRTFLKEIGFEEVKDYIDLRVADRVMYQ
ncbi:MAG: hypothetical protein HOG89_03570 [Candidatus Peribacter sp.]|jgi:hypothetical protein|nr:hypothetical protein [Candidatus Peribacter sp.]MBT4393489.1 hypothetical protein [Candidatus Peribacter sp.]MBT4600848.1 hypothetical protein [Candidatus Peribacter sp.]MBT5149412.1 hypothetical protein [Candidatus Peribacter sp.]MBT5637306.1 hypothetical protein [Candidatus Peribacter sp.]